METKDQKRGVRRQMPKINFREKNLRLKFVSKAEFRQIRIRENEANKAADLARRQVLGSDTDGMVTGKQDLPFVEETIAQEASDRVAEIKGLIRDVRKKLEKDPKSAKLKKQLNSLEEELNEAEDVQEEIEEKR